MRGARKRSVTVLLSSRHSFSTVCVLLKPELTITYVEGLEGHRVVSKVKLQTSVQVFLYFYAFGDCAIKL